MIGINFNALSFILYTLTRSQLPNNSSTCTAAYLYSIICSIISILNETSRTQTDPQSCAELARRPPNVRDRTQAAEYLLAVTHSSTTLGLRHVASISIVSRTTAIPAGSAFHACAASYRTRRKISTPMMHREASRYLGSRVILEEPETEQLLLSV